MANNNNNSAYPSSLRAWSTVAILMLAYVLSFIDRQILNLLVGPIRRDLVISDTQMSLLMGLSFALFYTVLGIPIARLADRQTTSRPQLIAVALALWSAMTALCGLAQNFTQLLLARIGVGVGEAGDGGAGDLSFGTGGSGGLGAACRPNLTNLAKWHSK